MTVVSISISFDYRLDGLGNWKTSNFTVVNPDESTTTTAEVRAHNYVNEITSVRDTTGGTPTTTPFTYDKNGNLLNDGVRIYQYDAFNRLYNVSNSSNTLLATYQYDVLNRRVVKTIADLGGGNGGLTGDIPAGTTVYLYDGRQIVEEGNLSDDYIWTQAYFWGQYIDELLFFAVQIDSVVTTYRLLSDLLYRSVALTDTSNNIVEAYDTDAYGNTLLYSGPGTDDLWFTDDDVTTNNPINCTIFTGRQYDPESQIYYYRARYYSPQIGRFISRDPLGSPIMMALSDPSGLSIAFKEQIRLILGMLDPSANISLGLGRLRNEPLSGAELRQGPNLYSYDYNSPVNRVDPYGLFTVTVDLTTVTSGTVNLPNGATVNIPPGTTLSISNANGQINLDLNQPIIINDPQLGPLNLQLLLQHGSINCKGQISSDASAPFAATVLNTLLAPFLSNSAINSSINSNLNSTEQTNLGNDVQNTVNAFNQIDNYFGPNQGVYLPGLPSLK